MSEKILVAPIGWYEKRLLKSIVTVRPDKVYLIKAKNGKFREITDHYLLSVKEKLKVFQDLGVFAINDDEAADFGDVSDVYRCLVKIIEKEKADSRPFKIILDVTSTTKDGALAASLVGQLYDITIAYVPPKRKYEWEGRQLKDILEDLSAGADDPGSDYLEYKMRSSTLDKESMIALTKAHQYPSSSIGILTEKILKELGLRKSKEASRKYWGRVYHRLETDKLVEIELKENRTEVNLTSIGKALVIGFLEAKKDRK
jgi:hypothetical protein